jgi:uncharacterized GH25 family protein
MKQAAALLVCAVLLLGVSAHARKKADQYCELSFLVLSEETGKPVRNAAVVLHDVKKNGKQGRSGFELKTDGDGKASYPGVPFGKLRVQVIQSGFQTFGDDFTIDQPAQEITIKLKRPQKQYSIYDK